MFLVELIYEKNNLDKKISELEAALHTSPSDNRIADELMSLIDRRQQKLVQIESANLKSFINLGGQEINISTAVKIRDTIDRKISVLTGLIGNQNCHLSKLDLIQQRERFFNEFILMDMAITSNDLQVRIDL